MVYLINFHHRHWLLQSLAWSSIGFLFRSFMVWCDLNLARRCWILRNVYVDPLLYEPFVDGTNSVSTTSQNYNLLLRCYIQAWHLLSTAQISRDSRCISQLSSGCVSRVRNSWLGVSRVLVTLEWVCLEGLQLMSGCVLRARNSRVGCVSEARSRVQTRNFARQLREDLLSRGKITREFVISSARE